MVTDSSFGSAWFLWLASSRRRATPIVPIGTVMGGTGASGHDCVVQTATWARQDHPNAIVIINDFDITEYDGDHNSFVSALHSMSDASAPIDAFGAQGRDVRRIGAATFKTYQDSLAAESNRPIYATEVDIDPAVGQEQLVSVEEEMIIFKEHPNVCGTAYWGPPRLRGANELVLGEFER